MRSTASSAGDLLLVGGIVLHPDGDLDAPRVEDILVRDGKIVALGAEAAGKADRAALRTVDLSDKLVVPGFINAHYHSHDVLLRGSFEGLPLDVWSLYSSPQQYSRRSNREVYLRTIAGALECLMAGITTVQDMVTVVDSDREHCEAIVDAYAASGIRAAVGLQIADRAPADASYGWRENLPAEALARLSVAPDVSPAQALVAELLAQGDSSRLDWVLAPSAPQRCSEDFLRWVAELSRTHGAQVFTHVYEAKLQALQAREHYGQDGGSYIRHLERVGLLNERLTIAHGVWIGDSEIAAMGAAGANVAVNPTSNLKLRNGIAPMRTYLDHGVGVAIGCDNCSGNDAQNIFESMKLFALFTNLQADAGTTGSAREAFRAATLGGAKALGKSATLGALRPGMTADITILDLNDPAFAPRNNLLNQLVYGAGPRAIHSVIVGGETVVEGGRPVHTGLATLAKEIEEAAGIVRADLAAVSQRNGELARQCLHIHRQGEARPFEFDRFDLLGRSGSK
ncbi:amidohydrolase family protein [Pelagibacterium lacus]|uniref:Amidohydrolase-related domain-containing protein n=1 Tax=Pelagibacterium lacus TaxID=2282655 RepID=A0A369W5Z4_9HYPH|nr:amidohydrolase family protein [Pelagibacterium lacus]RDE10084.1 hypothetical protein DVH29_03920 [Pelagibacterium lacus]